MWVALGAMWQCSTYRRRAVAARKGLSCLREWHLVVPDGALKTFRALLHGFCGRCQDRYCAPRRASEVGGVHLDV
jgi:hypothetical protein